MTKEALTEDLVKREAPAAAAAQPDAVWLEMDGLGVEQLGMCKQSALSLSCTGSHFETLLLFSVSWTMILVIVSTCTLVLVLCALCICCYSSSFSKKKKAQANAFGLKKAGYIKVRWN
jgi:hypothetical protein